MTTIAMTLVALVFGAIILRFLLQCWSNYQDEADYRKACREADRRRAIEELQSQPKKQT